MNPRPTPTEQWQAVLGELQLTLPRATFDHWLRETSVVSYEDGCFVIACKNAFGQEWLENRLRGVIKQRLQRHVGRAVDLRFIVRSEAIPAPETDAVDAPLLQPATENGRFVSPSPKLVPSLNAAMTFSSFIEGDGNRLAYAAAQAVAQEPGNRYNPLFLYGGVGLGKTHLLHAIGNTTAQQGFAVRYVSSETFTNDLIEAIRTKSNAHFRQTYRELDVLLIDDIQFIEGKEGTQNEFFHTFNSLYATNKQIVIASDRQPLALTKLEDRLRSRFIGGLTADLQPPDLEHRLAILRSKAYTSAFPVPEEVMRYIAELYSSNVRELQGALTRIIAFAQHHRVPLDRALAQHILGEQDAPLNSDPEVILQAIASEFRVTMAELKGERRSQRIVVPRQIAMLLLRQVSQLSFPQIGEALGGRDHATAMHGVEKAASRLEDDADLKQRYERVRIELRL